MWQKNCLRMPQDRGMAKKQRPLAIIANSLVVFFAQKF